jgi:hypothetical protein
MVTRLHLRSMLMATSGIGSPDPAQNIRYVVTWNPNAKVRFIQTFNRRSYKSTRASTAMTRIHVARRLRPSAHFIALFTSSGTDITPDAHRAH